MNAEDRAACLEQAIVASLNGQRVDWYTRWKPGYFNALGLLPSAGSDADRVRILKHALEVVGS